MLMSGVTVNAAQADDSGKLYALVHWDGKKTVNKGLALLPTDAADWKGQLSYVWNVTGYPYNYGACHFEDKYFCNFLRIMDGYILEQKATIFDEQTGEIVDVIQVPTAFDLYDGAYYEPEAIVYASLKDMSTNVMGWARLNPRTARFEMVRPYTDMELYGVAVNENGEAYGISGDGGVYAIDRTTGEATLLFTHPDLETTTVPKAHTGATWDEDNQRIIFAVCNLDADGGSRIFSVDPKNQFVDLMYKLDGLGTQLASLYFEQSVHPMAPDRPDNLKVGFEPGNLSGNLSFTLPVKTYDGSTLTGTVDYVVKIDGEKATEGSGNPGQTVTVTANIAKAGWHTFHVKCSNTYGKGRAAKVETYLGYETPLPPSDFSARYYAGKMHLNWQPSPSLGATGGPVNVSGITYVIRSNHGEVFETEPGELSYEYALTEPEQFTPWYFTLAAKNDDGTSAAVKSNNVPLGTIQGDYTQNFYSQSSQFDFTTVDANNDGLTWQWSSEGVMVAQYNEKLPMDDYLTLPPVMMNYGDYYVLDFDAGVYNFEEKLEVKLANDYNLAGLNSGQVVHGPVTLPVTQMLEESWHHQNILVQAPDDDKFFLSIHGISEPDMNVLLIDNIKLRKLAGPTVPAAVTDLKAIPDSKGAGNATLTGTLPTTDVAGNPLSSVDYLKITRNGLNLATVDLTPGATTFQWVDSNAPAGDNTYEVTAGNAIGDGLSARCTTFVGFVAPKSPDGCVIAYASDDYNTLEFAWTPVTEDLNGADVSDVITYDVIRSYDGYTSFASRGQKKTEYTENFNGLATPVFIQYGAYGTVNGLDGDMIVSAQVPVGPSCELPLIEGFLNEIQMPYGMDTNLQSDGAGLYTTMDTEKYKSPDNDGGYGVFIGNRSGESATLYTAWLAIPSDAVDPVATIQYFGEGDAISNYIHFGVSTSLEEDFKLAQTFETGGMGWQTAQIKLDQYRGKDVRIALKFETRGNTYLRFDDFRVYDTSPTGLDEIFSDSSLSVSTGPETLSVKGTNGGEVRVYALDGRKMYQGKGDVTLSLKAGIYIVNACGESLKVKVN